MSNTKKQSCPNIHYFGAPYVDAGCIDGLLWDLDSGSEPGQVDIGGDVPCPFCNTESFVEYIKDDMFKNEEMGDDGNLLIDESELLNRANNYVEYLKNKYL